MYPLDPTNATIPPPPLNIAVAPRGYDLPPLPTYLLVFLSHVTKNNNKTAPYLAMHLPTYLDTNAGNPALVFGIFAAHY